jgi:uncharacterized membrane protein (DUF4010 family)
VALAGVFIGATLWWFALSTVISKYRRRFRIRQLWVINRVAGIAMAVLGVISLIDGLYEWISSICG